MPDWVLVRVAAPIAIDDSKSSESVVVSLRDEILRRREEGSLSTQSLSVFVGRILDRLSSEQQLVQSRNPWPEDIPFHVRVADCGHFAVPGRISVRLLDENGELLMEKECWVGDGRYYRDPFAIVPREAMHGDHVKLGVEVRDFTVGDVLLAERSIELPVEYGPPWRESAHAIHDDLLSLIQFSNTRAFSIRGNRIVTNIDIDHWNSPAVDVAVGLRIEAIRQNSVLASSRFLYRPRGVYDSVTIETVTMQYQSESQFNYPEYIRVSADPAVALFDVDRQAIWDGETVKLPVP